MCSLEGGPYIGASQHWQDSEGFSGKFLPVIPFNSPAETEINISGRRPCQILVDKQETPLDWEPADGILGKLAEASKG